MGDLCQLLDGARRRLVWAVYFFGAAAGAAALLVNVNVPKMVPTTISGLPSVTSGDGAQYLARPL